jgi:hypothetical protein
MLGPISRIKQQFSKGFRIGITKGVKQQLTHSRTESRPTGLAGEMQLCTFRHQTTNREPICKVMKLSCLATAVNALKD